MLTRCLFLVVAVVLGGCATLPDPHGSVSQAAAPASTPAAAPTPQPVATPPLAPATPVYPSGPLQPIAPAESLSTTPVAALSAPVDLWDRMRRGFAMPDLTNNLVRDRERWYAARADYMQRMTGRSSKYLFHIVEELERRGLPTELALLPFVESAFNPQAESRAKAVGMWQFIPSTGKLYELKQNAFRDDRRDVLASTRAALDYLQKLYAQFGDWQLALAAYNCGEGCIARAITKNLRKGLGSSYSELSLPMETRFYVPKFQAIKNLVAHPDEYGLTMPVIENHPYFQTVDITRDIDVALAAKLAEVALEDFKALNPSLDRPVILAAGTPTILLPWDNAATFQRNLEAYGGARLASWTVWLVPAAMKPADAAKRVGMREAELRAVNHIGNRAVTIRAGSSLLVPRGEHLDVDVASQLADNGQINLAVEGGARRKTTARRSTASAAHGKSAKATTARPTQRKTATKGKPAAQPAARVAKR